MSHFTPVVALIGGLLIGLAASLLLWLNGRIAGVSGILGGLLAQRPNDPVWRLLFLAGLALGAGACGVWTGSAATARQGFPVPLLVIAGLLTGFGTARANGCTSGHGVCGLALFSRRSLVATTTFLMVAIMTTYGVRHVWGLTA